MGTQAPRASTRDELLLRVARLPLAARVGANLRTRCRAATDAPRIAVGVSGGPDSTALLLVLAALWRRGGRAPAPTAVTIHHGLRVEADEECASVARLARRLGIPFRRIDVHVPRDRGNIAAAARRERYDALRAAAEAIDAPYVAVAHHAEDRLETMLLAVARGRGLRGCASPRWSRQLGGGVRLLRPLLDVGKVECEALCDACDVGYAVDATNDDPTRGRGHLRRAVLPKYLARWPHAALNASRVVDEAAIAVDLLDRFVDRRFGPDARCEWTRAEFRAVEPEVAAWALRRQALRLACEIADRVPRTVWERAARSACDDSDRPRHFSWGPLRLTITANAVSLLSTAERDPSDLRRRR